MHQLPPDLNLVVEGEALLLTSLLPLYFYLQEGQRNYKSDVLVLLSEVLSSLEVNALLFANTSLPALSSLVFLCGQNPTDNMLQQILDVAE